MKVDCDYCGKEVNKPPSRINQGKHNFCDRECHGNWRSENIRGNKHPNTGNKVDIICQQCDSEFEVIPSRSDTACFCSTKCKGKWLSDNNTGSNNPCYESITVNCETCDKEIKREPYRLERNDKHFCSKKCEVDYRPDKVNIDCDNCGNSFKEVPSRADGRRFCSFDCKGEWMSENIRGVDHPRWKGGYQPYYGNNWREQRRKARERDNYECQVCGVAEKEIERQLDVHHVKPIRLFDDPVEANDLDNLLSVCRSCHQRIEGQPLELNIDLDVNIEVTPRNE